MTIRIVLIEIKLQKKKNKNKGRHYARKTIGTAKAERENFNMRIAEINFLIQGYEAAEKAEAEKKDQKESKK